MMDWKLKGIFSLFLLVILIMAGCGANKTEKTSTAIMEQSGNEDVLFSEFRDADGNFDFKGETLKVMWDPLEDSPISLAKIKKFEEECNAKVEIVAGGWGDLPSKLSSSIASGDSADVVYNYSTYYPDFIIADFLVPIDPYIPLMESLAREDDTNRFVLSEAEYFKWDGDMYAFTNRNASTHSLLFYNTTMFDELGLEYPWELEKRGEWTHEKFAEYAKALTLDKDGDGITDQWGVFVELFMLTMMLTSNDADIVQLGREAGEKTRLTFGDPATMNALLAYDQMVRDGSLGGDVTLGTAAMGFRGTWEIENLNTNLGSDGWGFSGAPVGPDNKTGVGAGIASRGYSLVKGSENPVMATVFIHYLLNVEADFVDYGNAKPPAPLLGFKNQEDYDRYLGYVQNLRKEDNHILEGFFYGFMYGVGGKPLATHIEEYTPELQAALDKVLVASTIVMFGDGNPFENITYEFDSTISPLIINEKNTTNAFITHSTNNGGALRIQNDALAVADIYAMTDPDMLVFEPGYRYMIRFDYTLNEAIGKDGKYSLAFVAGDKTLSNTNYGANTPLNEKASYEVEFDFYDDIDDGYLQFGGFNTSDILIENLTIETIN